MAALVTPALAAALLVLATAPAAADPDAAGATVRVFDKAAQHAVGLRTMRVQVERAVLRVPAEALPDPRAVMRVAATQPGTVEPTPGLQPGARIEAGTVLGWFRPQLPTPTRNELEAALAQAQRDVAIGQVQVERFKIEEAPQFEQKLPTPTLQVLTEYRSARGRSAAYAAALAERTPLRAPHAGRLLRAPAAAGRIVAAGETLFELDLPDATVLVAELGDDDIDPAEALQALRADGQRIALQCLGSGFDAEAGRRRAWYAPQGPVRLAIHERLQLVQPRGIPAIRVPARAVTRTHGENRVWVHTAPERFEPRRVEIAAREDDGRLRLAAGLAAGLTEGERIAVSGLAALASPEPPR